MARFAEMEVLAIREAHKCGESQRAIARRVGVSQGHIQAIVKRKIWRHV